LTISGLNPMLHTHVAEYQSTGYPSHELMVFNSSQFILLLKQGAFLRIIPVKTGLLLEEKKRGGGSLY